MPQPIRGTDSLMNFTKNPRRILEKLRSDGPVLLTVAGSSGVVVQDADSYQRLLEEIDRLEAIAGVKERLRDIAVGRARPARKVIDKLARNDKLRAVSQG